MNITQIFINDIKVIASKIEKDNYACESILNALNGKIEVQKVSQQYKKIIIRNVSNSIVTAMIDCEENKIKAISFNGSIDVNPKELWEMFKKCREAYSVHDDLYFYFFNEDKKNGKFILSFFEPSRQQTNIQQCTEKISNLTMEW